MNVIWHPKTKRIQENRLHEEINKQTVNLLFFFFFFLFPGARVVFVYVFVAVEVFIIFFFFSQFFVLFFIVC